MTVSRRFARAAETNLIIKFVSALALVTVMAVPVAYAGDPSNDKSSNVDHKVETKDGKASSGTVGAMNNGAKGGSFSASDAD